MFWRFWWIINGVRDTSPGGPANGYLTEDGGGYLLEDGAGFYLMEA